MSKLKVIYRPKGQALEYAPLATNPYKGCGHGCAYCYVPLATHQDRKEFDAGAFPRKEYLDKLAHDTAAFRANGFGAEDQVLFSFATDVYNPDNRSLTRPALQMMREHDVPFCVLTKGGTLAIEDADLYDRGLDSFACTLTTLDDGFSLKWERNAPLPGSRITALRAMHERGIFTWVSLEPTLDVEASLAVVEITAPFVDLYKVGRANYLKEITRTTDWRDYTLRMIDKMQALGKAHYIKHDLQDFLPPGYHNPLRVPQHH